MKTTRLTRQFTALFLCLGILSSFAFPAQAQSMRHVLYPKGPTRDRPKYCNGGWSGVVTYTKTLNDSLHSDEPITGRVDKVKNRIKQDMVRSYKYEGRATVDGTDPANALVNTKVTFTDDEKSSGEQKEFDTCHAFNDEHYFIVSGTDNRFTTATAEGSAEDFNLTVNEAIGTYHFSLKFPQAKGKFNREEHTKRTGFCQPKNNEPYDRSTNQAYVEPPIGFSVENQKVDLNQPDLLTGTYTWGDDGKSAVRSFVYTVKWHFTRCPGKILITDIKFEHPQFPDWDNWKELDGYYDGTIDGNRVRITAKVLNMSSEAKYVDVKITEDEEPPAPGYKKPPDIPIPDGEVSVRLEPGEERDVQVIWDTEGQAWNDAGQPYLNHPIKAEAFENGKKESSKIEDLHITPKPLVLVHGLWSSASVWERGVGYQTALQLDHGGHWKAYAVGAKPEHGKLSTGGKFMSADPTLSVFENAEELAKYVKYAQEDSNAWHVDMVAHSLGGLIARAYIDRLMKDLPDHRPRVKHLVMLGTPNNGTPCADTMALKFTLFGQNVQAIKDLQPESVAIFNQFVTNRKGVKFSAVAGNSVPVTCSNVIWNDGFVPVESALYGIEDRAYSNDLHDNLTNDRNFSTFVLPRIVTGPKGTNPLPLKSDPTNWRRWKDKGWREDEWGFYKPSELIPSLPYQFGDHMATLRDVGMRRGGPRDQDVSDVQPTSTMRPGEAPRFSHEVKLAPGQSVEVDVPVSAGPNFGLVMLADRLVSATLTDDHGAIRDTNLVGSPESGIFFRPLFTAKPVEEGTWKLKLQNTSPSEQLVLVAAWVAAGDTPFYLKAEKPNALGSVPIKALLKNSAGPIAGARVTAKISVINVEIEFFDDGGHGDGPAGDGVFGAVTEKLANADYTIEAKAEFEGKTKTAMTAFTIGKAAQQAATLQAPDTTKPKPRAGAVRKR